MPAAKKPVAKRPAAKKPVKPSPPPVEETVEEEEDPDAPVTVEG